LNLIRKSESNLDRHGIDFIHAQELWLDLDRVEVPAKTTDENRSMVIGKIGAKRWSAVITYCIHMSFLEQIQAVLVRNNVYFALLDQRRPDLRGEVGVF
jgi:uncharacterized DUF497 family protein